MPKKWFGGIILLVFLIALTVPALGSVRLAFDSTSLDFGSVVSPNTRELVLEVWDTAAVNIEIDQLSVSGLDPGDFSIISPTQYPVVLSPGTVHTQIILQFSPLQFGDRSADLVVETSDGNVDIPLSGFASGGPNLTWSTTSINFGTIAPGEELDTIIELYSNGTDTAFIDYIDVGSSDTSFAAEFANNVLPPVILAPGDSVAVQITFRGLPLTGVKGAQLSTFDNLFNAPTCELIGDDEYGSFAILPSPIFDFGTMYAGQVFDTTIQLVNMGDVALVFDYLGLSPSGEDFTLLNPPQYPFTLPAGDTLSLAVQANPGIQTPHRSQLQVVSEQAVPNSGQNTLTVSVIPPPITAPQLQNLSYYCATAPAIADTIPISNAGPQTVIVSGIAASDSTISLLSNISFPDTLSVGITQPVIVHFVPYATAPDTLVLSVLGGMQAMRTDTLTLQPLPTQANASIATTAATGTAEQHVEVSAANGLAAFNLDSIIVHISVIDSNVATIDPASIALAPGIANATIASVQPEPGGDAVIITSTSPITVPAGNPLVEMDLLRYVSSSDSTDVIATIETPMLADCLNWIADTITVNGSAGCGSAELRNFLSSGTLDFLATLRENPVSGQNAELSITANQISDTHYELMNTLGEICSEGELHLVPGSNDCVLSMPGIPAGVYTIRLITENGIALNLRLVKID